MFSDFRFITNIEDNLSHNYHLPFLLCFLQFPSRLDDILLQNNVFFLNILHAIVFKLFKLKVDEGRGSMMKCTLLRLRNTP